MGSRQDQIDRPVVKRSYSLVGPDTKKAIEAGFDERRVVPGPD